MTCTRETHTEGDLMTLAEVPTSVLAAFADDAYGVPAESFRQSLMDYRALIEELARRPFEPVTDSPWVSESAWRIEAPEDAHRAELPEPQRVRSGVPSHPYDLYAPQGWEPQ